jgi:hypothetical protein
MALDATISKKFLIWIFYVHLFNFQIKLKFLPINNFVQSFPFLFQKFNSVK